MGELGRFLIRRGGQACPTAGVGKRHLRDAAQYFNTVMPAPGRDSLREHGGDPSKPAIEVQCHRGKIGAAELNPCLDGSRPPDPETSCLRRRDDGVRQRVVGARENNSLAG